MTIFTYRFRLLWRRRRPLSTRVGWQQCWFWSDGEEKEKVVKNYEISKNRGGTRWCSWLMHCVTSRKAAGSIPDGVIRIFHWHNPTGQHYNPVVDSASNWNKYQEYFLGGKGGRCVGLTTLPPSWADCLEIWEPHPPRTLRAIPGL